MADLLGGHAGADRGILALAYAANYLETLRIDDGDWPPPGVGSPGHGQLTEGILGGMRPSGGVPQPP